MRHPVNWHFLWYEDPLGHCNKSPHKADICRFIWRGEWEHCRQSASAGGLEDWRECTETAGVPDQMGESEKGTGLFCLAAAVGEKRACSASNFHMSTRAGLRSALQNQSSRKYPWGTAESKMWIIYRSMMRAELNNFIRLIKRLQRQIQ